jgi:hypothetical protein
MNQTSPTQNSFKRVIAITSSLIGAAILAGIIWYFFYYSPQAGVTLMSSSVRPGEQIEFEIRGSENTSIELLDQSMTVLDASGNNVFVTDADFLQSSGVSITESDQLLTPEEWEPNAQAISDGLIQVPGFMSTSKYSLLTTYVDNIKSGSRPPALLETVGCSLSVGNNIMPITVRETYALTVLSNTPKGQYRLVLEDRDYCGTPGPSANLLFTVQ